MVSTMNWATKDKCKILILWLLANKTKKSEKTKLGWPLDKRLHVKMVWLKIHIVA
jgi:hypothetical protein